MSSQVLSIKHVFEARSLERSAPGQGTPGLAKPEISGRLVEISAHGAGALLTVGVHLVVEAQHAGEPTAWIMVGDDGFFPPDVHAAGVDLEALAVIRAPDPRSALSAASRLARSGSFGLIVVDLSRNQGVKHVQTAHLSRLVGMVQKHDMSVVFLTSKPAVEGSLDSLISLRVGARRDESLGSGKFRFAVDALKDKRRGPWWQQSVDVQGPAGIW